MEVDLRKIGGVGDGTTSNTAAFKLAVTMIAAAGGGTLKIDAAVHNIFLTGPFNCTSNMVLRVGANVTVLGSTNLTEWPLMPPMPSYGQGRDHPGPRRVSLVHGFNLSNLTLTGAGTIDGQGQFWWDRVDSHAEKYTRGHLIECMHCSQLELSHLTLQNSPFWTVHPVYCIGVHAHHLTILNPLRSPNTDGIDPDSTRDVLLEYNTISTGDDCYALKSGWDKFGYELGIPTANVTIRHGSCESPTSAGVCIGSEMSGGVEDVRSYNLSFSNCKYPFRIKTGRGRGGHVRRLDFGSATIADVPPGGTAFEFSEFYGGHPRGGYNASALPEVSAVHVHDVTGDATAAAELLGLRQDAAGAAAPSRYAMQGISFSHVWVNGTWHSIASHSIT